MMSMQSLFALFPFAVLAVAFFRVYSTIKEI